MFSFLLLSPRTALVGEEGGVKWFSRFSNVGLLGDLGDLDFETEERRDLLGEGVEEEGAKEGEEGERGAEGEGEGSIGEREGEGSVEVGEEGEGRGREREMVRGVFGFCKASLTVCCTKAR